MHKPTLDDERLAAWLEEIWRELERERAKLPIDELHVDAWAALYEAQVALGKAQTALLSED
jgi:hypothetical protein